MITDRQYVAIDNQLRLVLFGLECALNREFNPSVVEQIFSDSVANQVDEKRYTLWNEPRLMVTAIAEAYEPSDVLLTVESAKVFSPMLSMIVERAKYQAYRLEQWQDSEVSYVPPA